MHRLIGFTVVLGVGAALVLFVGYIARLPVAVWVAALVALCLSAVGALIGSAVIARREGNSIGASFVQGIREAARWLWYVTP